MKTGTIQYVYGGNRCVIVSRHLFVRKHVSEQTNAKRERADEITDQLDDENQRRDPPDRPGQMGQVRNDAVLFDADVVVVNETMIVRERR